MNLQPLDYFEAIYACGLKLLHRNYAGPLLQVARHNDGTEVLVYPDINGVVSLDSPIELLSGQTAIGYLGEFLCVGNYTPDPVLENTVVTAGAVTVFDQSANFNNLTNTDTATQPLLCEDGGVFFTDWGLGLSFALGRYYETNAIEQSFTLHMRMQFLNLVGSRYLFRQTGDALYAKITDTYLDEAVGTDSTVVFLNENYFRDYTTNNIQLPIEEAALITLEVSVSDNVLTSPPVYRIEGADLFHSLVMYSGVDEHVRRHSTNKILAEDVPALAEKLNRFNPQSYYNLVAGAKAMFGTFSFAGVLGPQNTRLMRLKREVGFTVSYIDLLVDNTGYITLNSPVENPSDSSTASVLGEWVAHPDYNNVDGIVATDALIDRLYSQINDANYAYSAGGFAEPKLYDSINEKLVSAGLNGVVGLEFYVPGDDVPEKGLTLNEPIYAKTVVVVYANKTANYEMNTLVATGYGGQIYSKFSGAQIGAPQLGEHGVSMYDQTNFSFTDDGFDIDVHVVSLYQDNQKLIVDTTEYPVNYDSIPDGIEGTELEDMARWEFIGASSAGGSFPHKGRICAVIYYDDDKYDQREFIHNYMNTLFGIQNLPISDSTLVEPEIQSTLLTDYPGAAAAYSLRKVNPEYDGPCIRVRRASDNVEIDVRFNSLYEVNQSALNVFCNGTDGFVTKWYDQANGNDATQATASNQPKIYDASTGVVTEGGKPSAYIDNDVTLRSASATAFTGNLENSIFVVASTTTASGLYGGFAGVIIGSRGIQLEKNSNNTQLRYLCEGSAFEVAQGGDIGTNTLALLGGNFDGTTRTAYINGAAVATNSDPSNTGTASEYFIGRYNIAPTNIPRYVSEFIIYPTDQSANREGIETEINGHYGIYDSGLLADYPDAAASYSLRQLRTSYTGPAVRVRRASDNTELNVYFDSTRFIDIAAIAAHCAGSDGFVSVWFDQSVGENDATQGTTSLQPKIYDASTGVELENAIAAMTITNGQGFTLSSAICAGTKKYAFIVHAVDSADTSWSFFADVLVGNTTPLGEDGSTSTTLQSTAYNPLNGIYKDGNLLSLTTRDDIHTAYTAAGQSLTVMDFEGSAGIQVLFNRGGREFSGTIQALVIYNADKSADRAAIETNINDAFSIYGQLPTGFLADYPGATAAYSLRQLVSTAKYAVAVRRDSDDAVLPIGFVDGGLDTDTLAAFCSGANGFVSVWFDQSNVGNHATQATTAAQPKIYDSVDGVILDGSKPAIRFGASQSSLEFENTVTPTTLISLFKIEQLVNFNLLLNKPLGSFTLGGSFPDSNQGVGVFISPDFYAIPTEDLNRHLGYWLYSGTSYNVAIDGNPTTTLPDSSQIADIERIGSLGDNSSISGLVQELIMYDTDQSGNRAGIESNINNHYTIYAPPPLLLNEYDGAAAAYSLRQLDNTYSGSAVRVRRESDNAEQDISFVNNELDTTALDAFCAGTNCYVTTWYDQANANDATQATTSLQPQIYDSLAGIVLQSGMPAIYGNGGKLNLGSSIIGSGDYSIFTVCTYETVDMVYGGGFPTIGLWTTNGGLRQRFDDGTEIIDPNGLVNDDYFLAYQNRASGSCVLALNGNTGTSSTNTASLTIDRLLSGYGNDTYNYRGNVQEMIFYPTDQSANRTAIETDINDHYTIYTPPPPASPTPVIESTSSYVNSWNGVGSFAVDMPTGVTAGDLILVTVAVDEDGSVQSAFAPTGYTELSWKTDNFTDVGLLVYYRLADGTEGSTIDVNYNTSSSRDFAVYAYRISGSNLNAPSQLWASDPNYLSTYVDFPSTATTSDNSLVIALAAFDGADSSPWSITAGSPPWPGALEGYIEYVPGNFTGVALGWISTEVATGSTDALRITGSLTDGWEAALIQVNNS